jgi:ethanolaminephosphotransferase
MLMAVNTYNGPILWMLLFLRQIRTSTQRASVLMLNEYWNVQAFYRGCELFLFTIICLVSRYHLFVWTVFSPKLLYELMETLVFTVLTIVFNVMVYLLSHKFKVE